MENKEKAKAELKIKSFRISDETAEAFKKVAESLGSNQQETMARLIDTFELQAQQVKTDYSDHKEDIERFQRHVGVLTNLYLRSLEDSIYSRDTINAEYETTLNSKDAQIREQAAKIKELTELLERKNNEAAKLNERANTSDTAFRQLQSQAEDSKKMLTSRISERDDLIALQSARLAEHERTSEIQKKQIELLSSSADELKVLQTDYIKLSSELSEKTAQLSQSQEQVRVLQAQLQDEHSRQNRILLEQSETAEKEKRTLEKELQAEHQAAISTLKTEFAEKILQLQQEYMAKSEQMQLEILKLRESR